MKKEIDTSFYVKFKKNSIKMLRKTISEDIFFIKELISKGRLDKAIVKGFDLIKKHKIGYPNYGELVHYGQLVDLKDQLSKTDDKWLKNFYSQEEYDVERNKIASSILQILAEIENRQENVNFVKYEVAIAELGKAVFQLLSLTKDTDLHNQAVIISFRYFDLKKKYEQKKENREEVEKLKKNIALIYSNFN